MTFPCRDLEKLPFTLGSLISAMAESGQLEHLNLSKTQDGSWQASCRRPGGNAYTVAIKDDPATAVVHALAPDYGHDWPEVLPKRFHKHFPIEDADPDEDDPEDLI